MKALNTRFLLLLLILLPFNLWASRNNETTIFELMNEGNTFEASNVTGLLKLIAKDHKDTWILYQNLKRFTPLTLEQRFKVLKMLSELTPEQINKIQTHTLFNLSVDGLKLVSHDFINQIKELFNKPIHETTLVDAATFILKYSPSDQVALEYLKKIAQGTGMLNVRAITELLTTEEVAWAREKLEEAALNDKTKNLVIYQINNKIMQVDPWPSLIAKIISSGLTGTEANVFLFNLRTLYPNSHNQYMASLGCVPLLNKVNL